MFSELGSDEAMGEQVQAQVGIGGVRRGASRSMLRLRTSRWVPRSASALSAASAARSFSASRPAGGVPKAGAGYQTSRTAAGVGDGGQAGAVGGAGRGYSRGALSHGFKSTERA